MEDEYAPYEPILIVKRYLRFMRLEQELGVDSTALLGALWEDADAAEYDDYLVQGPPPYVRARAA